MAKKTGLSRRSFLKAMAATVPVAAVSSLSTNAVASPILIPFFGVRNRGNGQTSNGYSIGQSLRISLANSAYLVRTPTATGSTTTYTFSFWVKRTKFGADQTIFDTGGYEYANFQTDDTLRFCGSWNGGSDRYITTTRVFRDPSAWYHIVLVYDANNATQSDRIRIYVNGSRETSLAVANYPASTGLSTVRLNQSGNAHNIGRYNGGATAYSDGYLAEFQFIDGYAYDPTYFGQFDTNTGQWIPKAYTGAYGTNGYYLAFADNSNTTATTLGKDSAPISAPHTTANNWTPTNFQTYDQVLDSPTNNFCTWNPLDKDTTFSTSKGNLYCSASGTDTAIRGTHGVSTDKWYWESTIRNSNYGWTTGVGNTLSPVNGGNMHLNANNWFYDPYNGQSTNTSWSSIASSTAAVGDTIMVAIDLGTGTGSGKIWWGKNGTWFASGAPASGTGAQYSNLSGVIMPMFDRSSTSVVDCEMNFGQGGQTGLTYDAASGGRFKYTPPAGFKALSTANLSAPAIKKPNQHFDTLTYTGNATAGRAITGLNFAPDFVWGKNRDAAQHHIWVDRLRGNGYHLHSSALDTEALDTNRITSLDSNGFTVGTDNQTNGSGNKHVAWCWKAGTSAQAGNESLNATAGFSIVKYSGNSVSGRNISHSLGVAPKLIIIKGRTNTQEWRVWHASLTSTAYTVNFDTAAQLNTSIFNQGSGVTSTTFGLSATNSVNETGQTYVAYLWAEVAGYSKFGSYTGNGSADGPFVYCGFKPRWVMVKRADVVGSWCIIDSARGYNGQTSNMYVFANLSNAESGNEPIDLLSNGFKLKYAGSGDTNASGNTYIFAAFAEAPFKYSTAR